MDIISDGLLDEIVSIYCRLGITEELLFESATDILEDQELDDLLNRKEIRDLLNYIDKPIEKTEKIEKTDKPKKKKSKSKYIKFNNVVGLCKRFDPELLERYDTPARNKIKEILGDFVLDNPNIYEQDLIINSPTCKYKYLELQVCSSWVGKNFPYPKLYIFARKARYGKDTLFLTINKFLTRGYLFDAESIKDVKPRRVKKYSRMFVYDVPWHRAMLVYFEDLDRETIEMY